MKKILDYTLSAVYIVQFWLGLLVFHVLQVIAFTLFGRKAQKVVVDYLNGWLLAGMYLTGTTVKFTESTEQLPVLTRPIIFVANHQSMYDIIMSIWFLRKYWPTFVSKKSLSKGIPSISYNLRKSGAAVIDRGDSKQSLPAIAKLGELIESQNLSALIFVEGTRSKDGKLKPFHVGGLAILLKKSPSALVVPVAVSGGSAFEIMPFFPVRSFSKLTLTVLPSIEPGGKNPQEVIDLCEVAIRKYLGQEKTL
jgi:1-acyl-sn-glycerol-3-phosphate acyltransferase